jgi:lipopolysaccharide transport system ATP-binding protein
MSTVLTVESVSKKFRLHRNRPVTFKESAVRWLAQRKDTSTDHWALRDVSFQVEAGQALGIIGHNGAGKSTMLRLLCGLGRPTKGRIHRAGTVSGLLDLGSGFHPDMSGRENIMTGGLLSGLTRREVLERQRAIIAFAELEQFIDEPVRTYSSGMYLRLAFATAIHLDPAVLIIDEVLAVGDVRFQQKCLERLAAFRTAGKTLILTSHSSDQIRSLCDEVLVLEEGQLVMQAEPDSAIRCYEDLMRERTEKRASEVSDVVAPSLTIAQGSRQGTQEAVISRVDLYDAHGQAVTTLPSGDGLTVELEYQLARPLSDMILSVAIYNELHVKCFETIIPSLKAAFGALSDRGTLRCELPELPLLRGRHYINVGLYPTDWSYVYDYQWQMHELWMVGPDEPLFDTSGVIALRPVWSTDMTPNNTPNYSKEPIH